ncbi:ribbon-helix-helix protein, CopG family [Alteromonas sp. 009811495]|uniref:ribbon-helix-helix protein, CopG family n=1 Tax=Alteromonas sp. 009811495 TaxID=3002962 RepID=UPI00237DB47B|nr:ribbon-helix-helix protein, CopG family [Alteromonas sp. 009811495]WDT85214.1 ribbon-helix-helix protein, CopG family [Alteromonas sp. 009811495]
MSLLNLKKSKPLVKPALRSVDAFIDDAILYAQGKHDSISTVPNNANSQISELDNRVVPLRKPKQAKGMRHATFTLTPECIDKLTVLSDETGSSRSALIRQWIQESYKRR